MFEEQKHPILLKTIVSVMLGEKMSRRTRIYRQVLLILTMVCLAVGFWAAIRH